MKFLPKLRRKKMTLLLCSSELAKILGSSHSVVELA